MDALRRRFISAVEDATAFRVHTIPLLPEDLFQALGPDSFGDLFLFGARDGMNSIRRRVRKCEISFSVNAE